MARKPRFILPSVPQHIIQIGNNGEPCFYAVEDYYREKGVREQLFLIFVRLYQ